MDTTYVAFVKNRIEIYADTHASIHVIQERLSNCFITTDNRRTMNVLLEKLILEKDLVFRLIDKVLNDGEITDASTAMNKELVALRNEVDKLVDKLK